MKGIEIPFGVKDSELCGWEYTIPEGMEAVIENGKVIVRRKESEDERIRKGLIRFILYKAGNLLDEETEHKFVAYLEKQKEQPMSAEEVFIRAGLKPYRDGNQWCVLAGGNIQEGICGFGDTIDEALYQFLMEVLKIQEEQKPAEWSEEDEAAFGDLMWCIEQARKSAKDENDMGNIWFAENWLKNRLKPLHLSKDCSSCAKHLEGYISGRCDAENKLLEQFGALVTPEDELHIKPRWKPGEEQMEALLLARSFVVDDFSEDPTLSETLESLYNDLKKL